MGIVDKYVEFLGKEAERKIEGRVESFLKGEKGGVYVDCGCGDGGKTVERAKKLGAKRVIGFEVDGGKLREARQRGVETFGVDLSKKWPLISACVDLITATETIEHLIDLDNFFSEARRVMKPGAALIISTENLASCHNILALLLGRQPYTGPYLSRVYPVGHKEGSGYFRMPEGKRMAPHINVMTCRALIQLLEDYGFRVKGTAGVGLYPVFGALADLAARIDKYHASYCVVKAVK